MDTWGRPSGEAEDLLEALAAAAALRSQTRGHPTTAGAYLSRWRAELDAAIQTGAAQAPSGSSRWATGAGAAASLQQARCRPGPAAKARRRRGLPGLHGSARFRPWPVAPAAQRGTAALPTGTADYVVWRGWLSPSSRRRNCPPPSVTQAAPCPWYPARARRGATWAPTSPTSQYSRPLQVSMTLSRRCPPRTPACRLSAACPGHPCRARPRHCSGPPCLRCFPRPPRLILIFFFK